jgi:DNA-binding transcriptional MerR regulator/methylmalonyl-CoA mutase cobalamin-binding subunit
MVRKKVIAAGHPIQVVSRRTGLSPEVLRVWEKRYGVVTPSRSAKGRRIYSDTDIERLNLLRRATLGGRRIGEISGLSSKQLRRLLDEDLKAERAWAQVESGNGGYGVEQIIEESMAAVASLDEIRLTGVLSRALVTMDGLSFEDEVLSPLLTRIGEEWSRGQLDPHHEHLATAIVRSLLSQILSARSPENAPVLVVGTLPGQKHEIGGMLAAVVAIGAGWRVVYLGTELPAREIAQAARQSEANAVAISLIYPEGDKKVAAELGSLARKLPDETVLVAGGQAASSYAQTIAKHGGFLCEDLRALQAVLQRIATNPK